MAQASCSCGAINKAGARFCRNCGQRIAEGMSEADPTPVQAILRHCPPSNEPAPPLSPVASLIDLPSINLTTPRVKWALICWVSLLLGLIALFIPRTSEGATTISFSKFYSEGVAGYYRSVTLTGINLEGTYKVPFKGSKGELIHKFNAIAPPMQGLGKVILSWKTEGQVDEFWCEIPSMLPKHLRMSSRKTGVTIIPFSTFYTEGVAGRYRSVTLTGMNLEGTYKVSSSRDSKGELIEKFNAIAPPMQDLSMFILSWKAEGQLDEFWCDNAN